MWLDWLDSKGIYQMQMLNGEKQGLTIKLSSADVCVKITYRMVQAVKMLDKGIVQSNLYSDTEIDSVIIQRPTEESGFLCLL